MIHSINPANEALVQNFEPHTPQQVEQALAGVSAAQKKWAKLTLQERTPLLRKVATLLRERKAQYGALITLEMGKPVVEAEGEVEKCAWNCEFYADNSDKYLGDEIVASSASLSKVVYDPLGIVLAVMPCN